MPAASWPTCSRERNSIVRFAVRGRRMCLAGLAWTTPSRTASVKIAVLSAIFTEAVRLGVVQANPAKHIRLPRTAKRTMLFLSREQVGQLAAGIDPHYRLFI